MKKHIHRFTLYAIIIYLTGSTLNPAVAATQPLVGNGTHFCGGVIDYPPNKQGADHFSNRYYARTSAANLNVGEPRTVRMIYFLPNDRPYRAEMIQQMKDEILNIQTFFAEQMEAHGYGRLTFRVETDAQGEPMVHRMDGGHPDRHYEGHGDRLNYSGVIDEINEMFDLNANIYFIIIDNSAGHLRGAGSSQGKNGGFALLTSSYFWAMAHELGHAFGLQHDFRDNAYIMSYGWGSTGTVGQLSPCHAEWLAVHPYFNAKQHSQNDFNTEVQMFPSSLASLPNAIRLRFEVTDPDGLHQAQLLTHDLIWYGEGYPAVIGCERLTGTSSIVEFVTTDLIPKTKSVQLQVIDAHGNFSWNEQFPIDITFLLPPSKVVPIPDANLASGMQHEIGWPITTHTMLNLDTLDIPNRHITDLTGLEHAHNLRVLKLGGEYINGNYANSNAVSNLSPLLSLPQLTTLDLSGNPISDLSALAGLPQLTTLGLRGNSISDVSALGGLTQLRWLYLDNNSVSDLSALGDLTQLTSLNLGGNSISDVSALAGLPQLTTLDLSDNSISNISALGGLTQLTSLNLYSNSISDISVLGGLTQLTSLNLQNNSILDISALGDLTQLTSLNLQNNSILDISALGGLTQLKELVLGGNSISDISALSGLTQLKLLYFWNNSISDLSALAGLTQLTSLVLGDNSISDISALAGLTQLKSLHLWGNSISDVSPLLELNLTGTEWDSTGLYLRGNPLSYASINTHLPAMQAKGIGIQFDPRTPTTLVKISGTAQQSIVNTTLALPFVVEVRDEHNRAFAEVPVTFAITAGSGKLSATDVTTDLTGRAQTRLTLGRTAGTTTVSVAAAAISVPVHFTAIASTLSAPVTVPDAALRSKIGSALGKPGSGSLTMGDMLRLTALSANTANIGELTGLQYAANLTTLSLDNNNLSDVALLAGLTQLTTLSLDDNNLSDISSLAGLTQLTTLSLDNNNLSDVSTLAELPQLKTLQLRGNPLNYPSLHTYIPTLQAGGAKVAFDPRTPTTVLKISGAHGVAGATLPFAVEVQDEKGLRFSGVPVTFSVTAGGGHLSPSTTTTDGTGRARITLTLGGTPGEHTVQVSAAAVRRPVSFAITAIDGNTPVTVPDAALRLKITTTLDKPDGARLTAEDMLTLTNLNVRNANIQNLTGLESAYNLSGLWLGGEWVSGQGYVNSNAVSNFSPLLGLAQLTTLDLSGNSVSDISALGDLTNLTTLSLYNNSISDISALAGLTQLRWLHLDDNSISDLSALAGLTQLRWLYLGGNSVSDLSVLGSLTNLTTLSLYNNSISDTSALAGLTQLNTLHLGGNSVSDVSPLLGLNLTGTQGDSTGLYLGGNLLSYASINTHLPAMQAKGIEVQFDPRTPTTLVKISGTAQQGIVNTTLALPFVVEVRDQRNRAFAEVPVTFAVTAGGGKLSATTATTDLTGRAQVRLTLGRTASTTTVSVAAAAISGPVRFTATASTLSAPVTVPDAALRVQIASVLGKPGSGSLTMGDMLRLTALSANTANIRELTGLQYATNLTTLSLDNNNLSDIIPIAGLTQLTTLSLDDNNLSDIIPLAGLTQLTTLSLDNNNFSDVSPLVKLPQLKTLQLRGNPLNYPSLHTYVPTLQAGGVKVMFDPRTPTTVLKISGTHGVAGVSLPFVVEVQDEKGLRFSGVPVAFSVTAGGGHLSPSTTITDGAGRARITLTLGGTPGEHTVQVSAATVRRPVSFTITAIDGSTPVPIPDVALRSKLAATLDKPDGARLTAEDMLKLTRLDVRNANIQNLTGLESAYNLRELWLSGEWVSGQGYVNSNAVSNFSPLLGLTQLTTLDLSGSSVSDLSVLGSLTNLTTLSLYNNSISDISALGGLTQLTTLYLDNNSISDISALSRLTQLRWLHLGGNSLSDISALGGLTQLTSLNLGSNSVSDISALAGLTQLNTLHLGGNSVSDISALSGLTQLKSLYLWNNSISDVSPLLGLNLTGTEWDSTGLHLRGNPLSYASINTHLPAMQAKGIGIQFDPRTPTTLVKISGSAQQGIVNTTLALPLVVGVRDQYNRVFAEVPVTFSITAGDGKLSATTATTDLTGRAQVRLTLGRTTGTTTVSVAAAAISGPVRFTATSSTLSAPITIPDAALRVQIASVLGKPGSGSLTMGDMLRLTALSTNTANIRELTGLQYAANLTTLLINNNNLSDVSPLAGLTQLTTLSLGNNNLADISPLAGLTRLTTLSLDDNGLSDVSPLAGLTQLTTLSLDNNNLSDVSTLAELPQLKTLQLRGNPLNYPAFHTYIPTLQAGGVEVAFDPRTPTTVLKISGAHGVAGATLPFVVEVQDEKGLGFSGVPVTFSVTAGGGHLSPSTATTDGTGRTRITLTLGGTPGEHTVRVSAAAVRRPVSFAITAIDGSTPVPIPDAALRSKLAAALDKPDGARLTAADMLTLTNLSVPNANIQDLTGLESAYNLSRLWLGGEWVSGQGYVNSNAVSNFSPLLGLTQLTTLDLNGNSILDISALGDVTSLTSLNLGDNSVSDISALGGVTQLTSLYLYRNSISDISALGGLTQLTSLYLGGNSISDISVLGGLTQLTSLNLGSNSVSDISALGGLTQLTSLNLGSNSVSDISALGGLTQLTSLNLQGNSVSDVSPLLGLNLTGTQWNSIGLSLGGNPLSYASINTHLPAMQAKGIGIQFDSRTPTTLVKISGSAQQGIVNTTLTLPFVVEVRDQRNRAFAEVPVTFAVTAGGGKLSAITGTTDSTGRAETALTLGPNLGRNTVSVSVTEIKSPVTFQAVSDTFPTQYLWSVPTGVSWIHVPLKVRTVDRVAKSIESVADLYNALGGASSVNLLTTYDLTTQGWQSYLGDLSRGTTADKELTDDTGIIAVMNRAASLHLSGDPLGTNGSSTITLHPGPNLVGVPLSDSRIAQVSDLLTLEGIEGNVSAIMVSDNRRFKRVKRAGDVGDIPITGGQAFVLIAREGATVAISGEGWANILGAAATPSVAIMGMEVEDVTPVLALWGSVVSSVDGWGKSERIPRPGMPHLRPGLEPGFRVVVKNPSTGKAVSTVIGDENLSLLDKSTLNPDPIGEESKRDDYQVTVVDIETARAAQIGDILEISVRSPSPLIGVEPVRYTVTAEDVKWSRIELPTLVAYEIPSETELLANYPNPFNPETWIPYRLAEDGFVTLTIYDATGQVVRTLEVGHRIAAVYEGRSKAIHWDGKNDLGEGVASGIYFYTLTAGDYSATRKMLILK